MCSLTSELWKSLTHKHLGKSVAKKWKQLMLDVKAVDVDVKPAYLYDIGPPEGKKLQAYVTELVEQSLIDNHLCILEVGMDCFIVNLGSFQKVKESLEKSDTGIIRTAFIDITTDPSIVICDSEVIRKELYEAVNIAMRLESGRVHLYVLSDSLYCNQTSLFGVLLGYPVVYWFDESKTERRNFLSMVPLCCVTVHSEVIYEDNNLKDRHTLYSFSYPSCHSAVLKEVMNTWFNRLKTKCKDTLFEEIAIETIVRRFEAICL